MGPTDDVIRTDAVTRPRYVFSPPTAAGSAVRRSSSVQMASRLLRYNEVLLAISSKGGRVGAGHRGLRVNWTDRIPMRIASRRMRAYRMRSADAHHSLSARAG